MVHCAKVLASLLILASAAAADSPPDAPQPPEGLLVNLLRRPDLTVITDPRPRFSWIVNDPRRGAVQTAYQIRLFSTATPPAKLASVEDNAALEWDSGKITSADSVAVQYGGKPLVEKHFWCWCVRTWDGAGNPSPWSEMQRFATGDVSRTKTWPGESRCVQATGPDGKSIWTFEDRHPIDYHPVAPVSVETKADSTVIDFGRAAFATLRVTLSSPDDARSVRINLGEKKTPDNHVDAKPGGSIFHGQYTLKLKQGVHSYDLALPRHISKMPHSLLLPEAFPEVEPFRYAEIENPPAEIKVDDVRQVALTYLFDDDAAGFASSDEDLNAIWNICKYTMKTAPFLGVYIDGVRERMPYEADCYIEQLGHYCVDREYAIQRYSGEFLAHNPTWPTEWILQSVLIAHADYLNTGDVTVLAREYELLKAKTLSALAREDGLISTRTGKQTSAFLESIGRGKDAIKDIVDWPQTSEADGYVLANFNTVVNAFHYRALVLMTDIAAATGHHSDAEQLKAESAKVKDAFNRVFFDTDRGIYTDGEGERHASLHANAFPPAFGLVPENRVAGVAAFVASRKMACGPYGAQFVVESLYEANDAADALALLTNKTDRSWLNMLRVGSTMTMESWDAKYKKNLTWNHAWGAAPANLIPRKLMGVQPISPGFAKIRIRPQVAGLNDATLKLPTIRGTVTVGYHRTADSFAFDITLPANTHAEVTIPTTDPASIRESQKILSTDDGFTPLGPSTYEIGAGTYHFAASVK